MDNILDPQDSVRCSFSLKLKPQQRSMIYIIKIVKIRLYLQLMVFDDDADFEGQFIFDLF